MHSHKECVCIIKIERDRLLYASKEDIIKSIKEKGRCLFMKTISIRLEDSIYEELSDMLDEMGQTKQTFFETFARTALRGSFFASIIH